MLVFFALGNAIVLSFALGDAKVPNVNGFASQWNMGLILSTPCSECLPVRFNWLLSVLNSGQNSVHCVSKLFPGPALKLYLCQTQVYARPTA